VASGADIVAVSTFKERGDGKQTQADTPRGSVIWLAPLSRALNETVRAQLRLRSPQRYEDYGHGQCMHLMSSAT